MDKKPLIMMCGYSGAGKTTTAKYLCYRFDWCYRLSPETIRKELGIVKYSRADTPLVFVQQMSRLKGLWAKECTGIIDNNLLSPIIRQMFYDFAKDNGVPVLLIHVEASQETLCERIRSRLSIKCGSPQNPDVLQRQKWFWQDPILADKALNPTDLSIIKFNTDTQEITCQLERMQLEPYVKVLESIQDDLKL